MSFNLTGQLLIAMPTLSETLFSGSLLFVCAHNHEGAMAIIINRPLKTKLEEMLERLNIKSDHCPKKHITVHYGGPICSDHGFILHRPLKKWASTIKVSNNVYLTTSLDALKDISCGKGPKEIFVSVGYAGWAPGQLENEFLENAWLNVPSEPKLIFNTPSDERINSAVSALGIGKDTLSSYSGQA